MHIGTKMCVTVQIGPYSPFQDTNDTVTTKLDVPCETYHGQAMKELKRLPTCDKFFFLLVCASLSLAIPWFLNQYKAIIADGGNLDAAFLFCLVRSIEWTFGFLKSWYIRSVATKIRIKFLMEQVFNYAMFSKTSMYAHPAPIWLKGKLQDAAHSISAIIDWGIPEIFNMIGTVISCCIIIMLKGTPKATICMLAIIAAVWVFLIPIRKRLAKLIEEHQEMKLAADNKLDFVLRKFMTKDCTAQKVFDIMEKPLLFDLQINNYYRYAGYSIEFAIIAIMWVFYCFSNNVNEFLVYLLLINEISNVFHSVSWFFNQFTTFKSEYQQFLPIYKEHEIAHEVQQLDIPNEGFTIEELSIFRGKYNIRSSSSIAVEMGKQYLIRGPSGSGKSTLTDAFQGFIKGIKLASGVPIGAYKDKIVVQIQSVQSIPLLNVSIQDVFDSNDCELIRKCLLKFFDEEKMTQILRNLQEEGKYDPEKDFTTHIKDKLSGGEKTRFFQALTVFDVIRRNAQIMVLDEPEQGLDPECQIEVFKKIYEFAQEKCLTVFWITHMRDNDLEETNIPFYETLRLDKNGLLTPGLINQHC